MFKKSFFLSSRKSQDTTCNHILNPLEHNSYSTDFNFDTGFDNMLKLTWFDATPEETEGKRKETPNKLNAQSEKKMKVKLKEVGLWFWCQKDSLSPLQKHGCMAAGRSMAEPCEYVCKRISSDLQIIVKHSFRELFV